MLLVLKLCVEYGENHSTVEDNMPSDGVAHERRGLYGGVEEGEVAPGPRLQLHNLLPINSPGDNTSFLQTDTT